MLFLIKALTALSLYEPQMRVLEEHHFEDVYVYYSYMTARGSDIFHLAVDGARQMYDI